MEEEVTDLLPPAASIRMPGDARPALEVRRELIFPVCFIQHTAFCNWAEEHEVDYRESQKEAVYHVRTDPPYNIKRVSDYQ